MKQRTLGLLLAAATLTGAVAQTQPTAPAPAQPAAPAAPATAPAVPSRPTRPAANYVALGIFYYQQGKFDEAYVAFRAATELDPKNAEALLGLGRSQVKLRLYAPAIETLRRLIALDPQNISGYIALSQAYQQQFIGASDRAAVSGNLAEALRVLERAEAAVQAQGGESKNLNLSKIWNERGYVYRLQGDAGKAIDAFKQA
ncbi:MAG: tetratricopeptide repeat protein, partial [Deinococcota bacterium]